MRAKKNIFILVVTLSVFIITNIQCSFLLNAAPLLLQGAVAMAVKGEATIVTRDGTRIRLTKDLKLSVESFMMPGSKLITGSKSSVDLIFTDTIKLRIGPKSTLVLDFARILEGKEFSQIKMKLAQGTIYASMNKLAKNSSFVLSTLKSLVNVRGTEFVVEETGSSNNVIVATGTVSVTDLEGKNEVSVEKGKSAEFISPGKFTINDINEKQQALVNEMRADMASLTDDNKKHMKEIIDNFEENKRLIRESFEAHKAALEGRVYDLKEENSERVDVLKEKNQSAVDKLKSSTSGDLQKLKDSTKK